MVGFTSLLPRPVWTTSQGGCRRELSSLAGSGAGPEADGRGRRRRGVSEQATLCQLPTPARTPALPGFRMGWTMSPFLHLVSMRSSFWASYRLRPSSSCSCREYCGNRPGPRWRGVGGGADSAAPHPHWPSALLFIKGTILLMIILFNVNGKTERT